MWQIRYWNYYYNGMPSVKKCKHLSYDFIRMLKHNITTNKVAKFLILYTFEDFELKYTLKMSESVGSTNVLYMFMNTSVR